MDLSMLTAEQIYPLLITDQLISTGNVLFVYVHKSGRLSM